MTLEELINKYNFHDSSIENISYISDKNELYINIDFCNWLQDDYSDELPENINISLLFNNVINYTSLIGELDSYTILNVIVKDSNIQFCVEDEFNEKYYEIDFSADSVKLIKNS